MPDLHLSQNAARTDSVTCHRSFNLCYKATDMLIQRTEPNVCGFGEVDKPSRSVFSTDSGPDLAGGRPGAQPGA